MTHASVLDAIAEHRGHRTYSLTAAGHAALRGAGDSCPRWKRERPRAAARPCLLDAGHVGRCDPDGFSTTRVRP